MKNILFLLFLVFSVTLSAQRNPFSNLTEKNGKIGIGTTNPDETLTVKGKIHTQEVLVDLQGAVAPDFVFEKQYLGFSLLKPEYTLPTLEELEIFLKENHHLPNIPSAAHLKENGINLKEMNLLLLQKIEELTLYTLQQQKELEVLKNEVNILKDKN